MPPAVFEHVDRARQVVLDELAAGGLAVDAGEHARVGRGVDDHVDGGQRLEVGREPDVGVVDGDAERAERSAIQLAAWPDEVVEPDEFDAVPCVDPAANQRRADEAAGAGDQNLSRDELLLPGLDDLRDRLLEADRDVPRRDSAPASCARSL